MSTMITWTPLKITNIPTIRRQIDQLFVRYEDDAAFRTAVDEDPTVRGAIDQRIEDMSRLFMESEHAQPDAAMVLDKQRLRLRRLLAQARSRKPRGATSSGAGTVRAEPSSRAAAPPAQQAPAPEEAAAADVDVFDIEGAEDVESFADTETTRSERPMSRLPPPAAGDGAKGAAAAQETALAKRQDATGDGGSPKRASPVRAKRALYAWERSDVGPIYDPYKPAPAHADRVKGETRGDSPPVIQGRHVAKARTIANQASWRERHRVAFGTRVTDSKDRFEWQRQGHGQKAFTAVRRRAMVLAKKAAPLDAVATQAAAHDIDFNVALLQESPLDFVIEITEEDMAQLEAMRRSRGLPRATRLN